MQPIANPSLDFAGLANLGDTRCFSEAFDPSQGIRSHWQSLLSDLGMLRASELADRFLRAQRVLSDNGLTFNVFADAKDQRPWQLDLVPATFSTDQWNWLENALAQRSRLFDLIIKDIYGPQQLLTSGLLPPEVVFAQPKFQRAFCDLHDDDSPSLLLAATELARGSDGLWRVMADRADAPNGLGFALENRIVTARFMPQIMHRFNVDRLAPFFLKLKHAIENRGAVTNSSSVAVFTLGPESEFYFEDVYLARYLGYDLVEGGDLAVRDEYVYLKTLSGLRPIEVLLCRCSEDSIDPLEQGAMAGDGVPGLLQAIRQGRVEMANVPGCGIIESPIFMAFLPQLCQQLLGEELLLNSIPTYWLGQPEARSLVRNRLSELVIKPAFQKSGQDEFIMADMTEEQAAELWARVESNPTAFIAQECIARSSLPCWRDGKLQLGHVALRTFSVASRNQEYETMPGGLARIAESSAPIELSITAGISSKDVWIQRELEQKHVSLLQPLGEPVEVKRSQPHFPSRVADNLYWYGQSLERSAFLARLLSNLLTRFTSEATPVSQENIALHRALTDQGQFGNSAPNEALRLLSNDDEHLRNVIFPTVPGVHLKGTMDELARLNARVRDWISPELWRSTQLAVEQFSLDAKIEYDASTLLNLLRLLQSNLAAASGQIHDAMVRGPAWRFLDIGRRIDRAANIAKLLLSIAELDMIGAQPILKLILELLDCRMTYRTRYFDNVQPIGVLDLAITDETNPNSIGFQTAQLVEHVDALPQEVDPLRSAPKRTIMKVVHEIRMMTDQQLEAIDQPKFRQTLESITEGLKDLNEHLTRIYLVHSVQPRQMNP